VISKGFSSKHKIRIQQPKPPLFDLRIFAIPKSQRRFQVFRISKGPIHLLSKKGHSQPIPPLNRNTGKGGFLGILGLMVFQGFLQDQSP